MDYRTAEVINKLSPLLQAKSPDLEAILALRMELGVAVADTHLLLAAKKRQMLWPKDKELTEMDRKIRLDADVGQIERDYILLKLVWEIVSDVIRLQSS